MASNRKIAALTAYHRKNSGVNSVYWKNSAVNAKQPQKERRCFTRRKRSVLLFISAVIPAFFPLLLAQKWPPFFELRSERQKISRKNRICCFSLTKHFSCFGLTEPVGRLSFEHWNLVNSFSDVMVLIPTRHTVDIWVRWKRSWCRKSFAISGLVHWFPKGLYQLMGTSITNDFFLRKPYLSKIFHWPKQSHQLHLLEYWTIL